MTPTARRDDLWPSAEAEGTTFTVRRTSIVCSCCHARRGGAVDCVGDAGWKATAADLSGDAEVGPRDLVPSIQRRRM